MAAVAELVVGCDTLLMPLKPWEGVSTRDEAIGGTVPAAATRSARRLEFQLSTLQSLFGTRPVPVMPLEIPCSVQLNSLFQG
jgi:hypothetical protein